MIRESKFRQHCTKLIASVLCIALLLGVLTACQVPTAPTQGNRLPTGSQATDPTPPIQTPTLPDPADPVTTDPVPTDPATTESAPTAPAPTAPKPTEPAPTDPPADDYSWLVGTWTGAQRTDFSYGDYELRIVNMRFNEDGTGEINKRILSSYDFDNNYNTNQWNDNIYRNPVPVYFTYIISEGALYITYNSYNVVTVEYPLPQLQDGRITLPDPEGHISGFYIFGEVNNITFAKDAQSLSPEELCAFMGVDYALPTPLDNNSISGTWMTVCREDWHDGYTALITYCFQFNSDGTCTVTQERYAPWDQALNKPSDKWNLSSKAQYDCTYKLQGYCLRMDYEEYMVVPLEDSFISMQVPLDEPQELGFDKVLKVESNITLEELCATFGVDYSLPPAEEPDSSITIEQLTGSWQTLEREDLQGGVYGLRYYMYTFRTDGTGELLRGCYSNVDYDYNFLDHWIELPDERWSLSFSYTYSDGIISIDGTPFTVELSSDGILCLTDMYQSRMRYMNMRSDPSLYELCRNLGVDCSVPLRDTALHGTFTHIEPVTSADGIATLAATDYCFKEDGTGIKTIREYNMADRKWESVTSSFTFVLEDMLYITYDNGDRAFYEVFLLEDGIISISDEWNQYVKFVDNNLAPTLEDQCYLLGIENPIPAI